MAVRALDETASNWALYRRSGQRGRLGKRGMSMGPSMAADGMGRDEYQAAYDITVEISVVLGKATLRVNQLLKLGRGAVVELDQKANEPVEVYANDRLIAFGQVIVTEGNRLGVTLTELVKSTFSERPI